ncbi:MAG TPA: DNA-3-methyladenine glycosylase, partial [Candidatus Saccharimonadales bacterium]|nr:DNA-3-methyladenine glycosylase [Candidatus Saccharimonadales bacterium]
EYNCRMQEIINDQLAQAADQHLRSSDPVLKPIIDRAGPCPLRPHRNYYWELVDAIISQQLSVKAAASIERRFQALFDSEVPTPEQILASSIDELRSVGLSRPKASYILDLAEHIVDGQLKFDRFDKLSDQEIIKELTDVKGIGEWTAHMFLMFCMARADVLPVGDLGIKNSIRTLYGLDHLPTEADIKAIANKYDWAPYRSIASWYIWQNLDNTPKL